MMDIQEIHTKVRANEYVYSHHAEIERVADELTFAQVEEALLSGEILEDYPDTGRGEHIVIITVYIPGPPTFLDPWTRA
jgi:hypothetical protein